MRMQGESLRSNYQRKDQLIPLEIKVPNDDPNEFNETTSTTKENVLRRAPSGVTNEARRNKTGRSKY